MKYKDEIDPALKNRLFIFGCFIVVVHFVMSWLSFFHVWRLGMTGQGIIFSHSVEEKIANSVFYCLAFPWLYILAPLHLNMTVVLAPFLNSVTWAFAILYPFVWFEKRNYK